MKLHTLMSTYTALLCALWEASPLGAPAHNTKHALVYRYVLHAKTSSKKNNKEEALIYYQKALDLRPSDTRIMAAMAHICTHLELFERAAKLCYQALSLDPTNIELLFDSANMFTMIHDIDAALPLYQKILSLNPHAMQAQHNYAYALQKKGYIAQAIDVYQDLIAAHPDYALAHFSLALAYLSLGDFERGLPEYEWRWRINNKEPHIFNLYPRKEIACIS